MSNTVTAITLSVLLVILIGLVFITQIVMEQRRAKWQKRAFTATAAYYECLKTPDKDEVRKVIP